MAAPSYLIVGAGVFGVSTAYHLIKRYPNASVTLVDRDDFHADSRVAASWDWNKVVRADYDDIDYCRLALEAQDVFRSDPLWKPFFHETGIYWICRSNYAQEVIANYKKLGRNADLSAVPIEEARKLYGGIFDDADYTDVKEVLVNKTSGWGAAGNCLQVITRKTVELGVGYVTAEVKSLKFDAGRCVGAITVSGDVLSASHVILSTGAFTAKLLELSAEESGMKDLRAGCRIVAGGITTGLTQPLDEKSIEKYSAMPVGMQGYTAATGPFIGSLPPTPERELKWWGQTIFTYIQQVLPGRWVSAPPAEPDYAQWKVSNKLKADISHAQEVFYKNDSKNWKPGKYRICWDAFTTSGDFIIAPHTAAKGLYVATCGSFHGWKFFPVLGKYVVQMLEGQLAPNLVGKWAWDRERPDPSLNPDFPRAEFGDLQDPVVRTSRL